jgi:hypothetical protein
MSQWEESHMIQMKGGGRKGKLKPQKHCLTDSFKICTPYVVVPKIKD